MGNTYKVELTEDKSFQIEIIDGALKLNGEAVDLDIAKTGKDEWNVIQDNHSYTIKLLAFDMNTKEITLSIEDEVFTMSIKDRLDLLLNEMGMSRGGSSKMTDVKAPMPGLVLDVMVAEGQEIKGGDALIILEAMKMENVIKSTGDGIIKSILIKNQDTVEKNQVLIEME